MFFVIGSLIIAIAASAISIKTLVGYTPMPLWVKILASLLIILAWLSPITISAARRYGVLDGEAYRWFSDIGYFLFGTAFILVVVILLRDFVWFGIYEMAKLLKSPKADMFNPSTVSVLTKANLCTVVFTFALAFYALYSGIKTPDIKEIILTSPKIKQDYTIVQLSDVHVNRTTPIARIENLVEKVNALQPDAIVLTGDIGDDKVEAVEAQMDALAKLQAKHGVFVVFGNHELYNGLMPWQFKFGNLDWTALFNYGIALEGTELYIGGIPDVSISRGSPFFKIDLEKTLDNSSEEQYKILLSHSPNFQEEGANQPFDLQLSGHTHGGQIFPFHLLVKQANKYLAGLYEVNGRQMYISRGTGYWGPPMRLFAPSEITVIKLRPDSATQQ